MVAIMIIIFTLPFIWIVWSLMDVKNGKREKAEWKKPMLLLLVLILLSGIANFYFYQTYNLPIFPNIHDLTIGLIVTGSIVLILTLINLFVSFLHRGMPKEVHNPNAVWVFTGSLGLVFLLLFAWILPFSEKANYVLNIEAAMNEIEASEQEEEMTVLLLGSTKDCMSYCTDYEYDNIFFVKNNMDEEKEVQVKIRALNKDSEEMKVIDSLVMKIGPNELRVVETEETIDRTSVWSKYSFKTDERTVYYDSMFRFRDPE